MDYKFKLKLEEKLENSMDKISDKETKNFLRDILYDCFKMKDVSVVNKFENLISDKRNVIIISLFLEKLLNSMNNDINKNKTIVKKDHLDEYKKNYILYDGEINDHILCKKYDFDNYCNKFIKNTHLVSKVGVILKEQRRTQTWLGQKTGIPRSTMFSIVNGSSISLENALKIQMVLDVPFEELFYLKRNK